MHVKKVVVAYSGGLDTSVILRWVKEKYNAEVIACAVDVGQASETKGLKERALKTGASKFYLIDARKEFVTDYIWPMLQAEALYENKYFLGTSIARPVIAKKVIEIAKKEGADAVCHGSTGKGNDQVRFEITYMALAPQLKIIAPWKDDHWTITSREEAIAYAEAKKIPITVSKEKIYSRDRNLWHISHEGGELEDPWNEPKDQVYQISKTIEQSPDKPLYVEIEFVAGTPVAVNGKKLEAHTLLAQLNAMGAEHAVGQIDIVENRLVGIKSRGVYETPGGTILYKAHQALENLILDKETFHYKEIISKKYAELVYNGLWFTPLREALDAFINETQKQITGTVRLKLFKGHVRMAGTKSPYSLYRMDVSSFSKDPIYEQKDAIGFIKLLGLPYKLKKLLSKGSSQLQNTTLPFSCFL
jgi:argininosuccinate synthase